MLVKDDRAFKRSLDEQTAAQQRLHIEALDRALAKHDEVRTSAERTRERVELEFERERRRREDEEQKAIEKARRDLEQQKLEEQKRQLDNAKVREDERRKRETLNREQEEARRNAEAQKQREAEESRRSVEVQKQRETEQLRRSTQENAERVEAAQTASEARAPSTQNQALSGSRQPVAPSAQTNGVSPAPRATPSALQTTAAPTQSSQLSGNLPKGLVSSLGEREAVHNRYLDLHKRLKQMRAQVSEEVKKVNGLKNQLSDWRRAIHKCCGQLGKGTADDVKAGNRRAVSEDSHTSSCLFCLLI